MYKITRIGDKLTHGAVVITGDSTRIVDGIPVARVGDLVNCPVPGHGVNPIIAVVAAIKVVDGKNTSHLSSISACGAMLITGSDTVSIDRHPDSAESETKLF